MKKLFIPLFILASLLAIGCAPISLEPGEAEAADPLPVERPVEESVATKKEDSAEVDAMTEEVSDFPIKYCPVTQPPEEAFQPPEPYRQEPYPGQFFYGDNDLWTAINLDQTWAALPYTEGEGYGQKLFYQRDGYYWIDELEPALTVTGRKIDPESAEEETLSASKATNGYTADDGSFMLVGATFPSLGCWEITAQYQDSTLTYTIWIGP